MNDHVVEREWITKAGYKARCIRYETEPIPSKPHYLPVWRCGYVEVPPTHQLYCVDYSNVYDKCQGLGSPCPSIHGGLTYGEGERDDDYILHWWFGFDTHRSYNHETASEAYIVEECEKLAEQLASIK